MKAFIPTFAWAALTAVLAAGCATSARPYAVTIDPKTSATLNVDLVAVPDAKFEDFMSYPVSSYWLPNDPVRQAADKIEITVSGGKATPPGLTEDDSHWNDWLHRGATHLVVIADLHGDFKDSGKLDPRRCEIDLKKKFAAKTITVEIQDRAVKIITPFK